MAAAGNVGSGCAAGTVGIGCAADTVGSGCTSGTVGSGCTSGNLGSDFCCSLARLASCSRAFALNSSFACNSDRRFFSSLSLSSASSPRALALRSSFSLNSSCLICLDYGVGNPNFSQSSLKAIGSDGL